MSNKIGISQNMEVEGINLSTGASIFAGQGLIQMGKPVQPLGKARATSKDSQQKQQRNKQSAPPSSTGQNTAAVKRNNRSKSKGQVNNGPPQGKVLNIQIQPSQQQVKSSSQLKTKKETQKLGKAHIEEDPSEVYKNKKTHILDDEMLQFQALIGMQPIDEHYVVEQEESKNNQIQTETLPFKEDDDEDVADSQSDSSDGNVKLSRYILGKQIGQGAYAVVRVATNKSDNKKYAIKVYDKSKLTDSNRQRSVRREIKLLQKMNHPNIVKIYEAFETDEYVYLVMEYVGGGSLHSYLREKQNRRLEESDAKRIFKQILTALHYCHRKSIAHRDIKLENILLDDSGTVKLIDFGFSTCIPNDKKIKMFCGTPSYMGPEIVAKEDYAGPPADIWASAVLLYALLNGCFPFRGATDKELYRRIQRGTFELHNQSVSDQFVMLLKRMLNIVADERPSAEEVLKDPWFTGNQVTNTLAQKAHLESIQEQKRLFKEKILGKIPVEKNQNTICLNSGQDTHKLNRVTASSNAHGVIISGSGAIQNPSDLHPINSNQAATAAANDFSDYGLQQQNNVKRLNQEAYQAYYNTSGATSGQTQNTNAINPYYNNFFQTAHQPVSNPALATQQQKTSPNKGNNPQLSPSYAYNAQPQKATEQVGTGAFASPTGTAFHCSGGMINNNFIFQIFNSAEGAKPANTDAVSPQMMQNGNLNLAQVLRQLNQKPSSQGATQGALIKAGHQHPGQNDQNQEQIVSPQTEIVSPNLREGNLKIETQVQNYFEQPENVEDYESQHSEEERDPLDEEIVESIAKLGFNKSQIVQQLKSQNNELGQKASNKISMMYQKLKEDKLSKTAKQNRAISQQPQNRRQHNAAAQLLEKHNFAVFPNNFIPSIPDAAQDYYEDKRIGSSEHNLEELIYGHGKAKKKYKDEINDDYRILQNPSKKSPRV
ncbi:hypothetical protein FGO68_gene9822 [Halteria grandinella]|uniref:Protein kinase domain containing protein n=1 Tax=Halteria grandinella TaxID=5974 RepID=A0A8J8NGU7_HALGN|nr:hypothetical protein FGO68_gene9822 [Halteria grandinella]